MRRILSIALALVMVLSIMPVQVLSEGDLLEIEELLLDEPAEEVVIEMEEITDAADEMAFAGFDDVEEVVIDLDELTEEEATVIEVEEISEAVEEKLTLAEPETVENAETAEWAELDDVEEIPVIEEEPVAEFETPDDWARSVRSAELGDDWAKNLANVAKTQVGYAESQNNFIVDQNGVRHGYTRYGDWFGAAYADWSAIFVSFCLNYAGIPASAVPYAADSSEWIGRFESMGVFMDGSYAPQVGDIVFFDLGGTLHVGVVVKADGNEFTTVEGDVNNAVVRRTYDVNDGRVIGFASMSALMVKAGVAQEAEVEEIELAIDEIPAETEEDGLVLVVDGDTEIVSVEAMDYYFGAPEVFAEPSATTVALNDPLKITATLKNFTSAVTYQWEKSSNNGKTWSETNLYGFDTNQLSFKVTNETRIKYMYRCVVTDAAGNVYYSNGVMVNLMDAQAAVVTATVNSSVAYPDSSVKMTASVTNTTGTVTYQWQKTSNNGKSWSDTNLYGNQTKELSFKASDSRLRWMYRCAVTDDNGTYYSNTLQVTFIDEEEPNDDVTVTVTANKMIVKTKETVELTASVQGSVGTLAYQWQESRNEGATWTAADFSTSQKQTMSFPATATRNSKYYRCAVTDDNGTHFSEKIKVVLDDVDIIATPEQEKVPVGGTVVIHGTTTNTVGALTYQWERCKIGSDYISKTTLSGNSTDTLTFDVPEKSLSRLDYQYRLAVTDDNGVHYSNWVLVEIGEVEPVTPVTVTAVAEQEKVPLGGTVVIHGTVEDAVGALTYQWQRMNKATSSISNTSLTGNASDTLTFTVTEKYLTRLDYLYRLSVTDDNGTYYSDWVLVEIGEVNNDVTVNDITYRLTDDNEWTVIGYVGTASSYVVEAKIDGKDVTRIGEGAFENNQNLVSIDLPDSIEVIEKRAFKNCTNLANMF